MRHSQTSVLVVCGFAKASLFTLVVPGIVVVLVPYLLLADASLDAVDFLGTALLGLPPLVLGTTL